jgi:hypothetical protein
MFSEFLHQQGRYAFQRGAVATVSEHVPINRFTYFVRISSSTYKTWLQTAFALPVPTRRAKKKFQIEFTVEVQSSTS